MIYFSSTLFFIIVLFLFFIFRRTLYYQNLIEESTRKKDYASALLYSRKNGSWWLMNYYSEKIEKEFIGMSSINAVGCIEALIEVGDARRARRILFNKAKERKDNKVLLKYFWQKVNNKAE